MLEQLKQTVYEANLALVKHKLVIFTWGNVSAYDKNSGYVVIKPSGVAYDDLKASDMVVVDLEGQVIEGNLKPSSDTLTHLEIYKHFDGVYGIVHTHSKWATIFAQSQQPIPSLGTTHADYFNEDIPLTKPLNHTMIATDYEKNTGVQIVNTFKEQKIDPNYCPAVLVNEHGPFAWGKDAFDAVHHAVVLEYLAEMAHHTIALRKTPLKMDNQLHKKHFYRKHGKNKYYGQK